MDRRKWFFIQHIVKLKFIATRFMDGFQLGELYMLLDNSLLSLECFHDAPSVARMGRYHLQCKDSSVYHFLDIQRQGVLWQVQLGFPMNGTWGHISLWFDQAQFFICFYFL